MELTEYESKILAALATDGEARDWLQEHSATHRNHEVRPYQDACLDHNAADEIERLRVALNLACNTLAAFMNLPIEADAAWIEQEKEDLAIMDKVRAALGLKPWLETLGIG